MQLPDIELSELRYFHCVATSGSFAEGARLAYVSASTVSKAIKKLEQTLGVTLFERSSRHIALTDVGHVVLEHAMTVLGSIRRLSDATDDATGLVRGDMHLGSAEEFAAHALPVTVCRLARSHPQLRVHTYVMGPEEVERRLLDGELDLGLVCSAAPPAAALESRVLICSPNSLVCGRGHPLYEPAQVEPDALAAFPFVVPRFFGEPAASDRYPSSAPSRTIGATVELVQMAIQMAMEGGFLAYLPDVMIRCQLNHEELRRVDGIPAVCETELRAWQRVGTSTRNGIVLSVLHATLVEMLGVECAP